jgi:GTP-binding protein
MNPTPPQPLTITEVVFEKGATRPAHYPRDDRPQIAFAGRSNVGKSSLLNVLVNRKRLARVSSTPGHTQMLNFFLINDMLHFVDLPGYGFARAPKSVRETWGRMIVTFLRDNPHLKCVVAIFDIRHDLTEEDYKLAEWLAYYQIPFIAVLTKADKLSRSRQMEALREKTEELTPFCPLSVQLFSATSRQGKEELLASLGALLA